MKDFVRAVSIEHWVTHLVCGLFVFKLSFPSDKLLLQTVKRDFARPVKGAMSASST